ncbi:DUF2071 domain-containing protein [Luteimonas deserti]|nr:DUF2071 domain-containing protein [Luteimonas deserti]
MKFADALHARPEPSGIDIACGLKHFAIITYAFDPLRFAGVMPDRFKLDTVGIDGQERALLSVVPFIDVDFTSAVFPFPSFEMGQTNYRIYIIDRETGEKCVWFLGTTLDSWTRLIPHAVWKLPWYGGRVEFDAHADSTGMYGKYSMRTRSQWAPASVELKSKPHLDEIAGFPDRETALVYLTHPLRGFYHRRDGRLGTYHVWHDRLNVHMGHLVTANFGLLDRLGLVRLDEQQNPHSVLLDPLAHFTIYLPPRVIPAAPNNSSKPTPLRGAA